MYKILVLSFLLSGFISQAQKNVNPEPFANTITVKDLKKHLYIIAGKEMEGRETGTPGQRRAAAYIEKEFRRIGLQPGNKGSFQYNYPLYQDSITSAILEVNGQKFIFSKDFAVNANNFNAQQAFSEGVYISQRVPADSIKPGSLTGKLVIVTGESRQMRISSRARPIGRIEALRKAGPAAILYIDTSTSNRRVSTPEVSITLFKKNILPQQFTISEKIARALVGKNYGNTSLGIQTFKADVLLKVVKGTKTFRGSNVMGVLPGTDLKNEYLYITAHYDHLGKRDTVIFYGADDDGSGTVGVIELAEAMVIAKSAGNGPRRTIVFMTVSGEEKGLLGSEHYSNNPVYPMNKTTADLNIDMVGRSDNRRTIGDSNNYVYIVGDDKLSTELKPINEGQNKKYVNLELDYKYNDPNDSERIYFRSDHYNFAKNGVPIIFYTDGMNQPDYHRPGDTPDKINYELLQKRIRLVFYTAWDMANRDSMLKRDIPLRDMP